MGRVLAEVREEAQAAVESLRALTGSRDDHAARILAEWPGDPLVLARATRLRLDVRVGAAIIRAAHRRAGAVSGTPWAISALRAVVSMVDELGALR